jgi:hypothetical protein
MGKGSIDPDSPAALAKSAIGREERRSVIAVDRESRCAHREAFMGRGILLWLIGIPIPIIILLLLFLD